MIFVNDKKYACETCIKGHRSSSCQHTERALFEIKKKGRPVTQCDHCRELRKTKQVHVRCSCDAKPDHAPAAPKPPGGKKGSRLPAEAAYPHGLSPAVSGLATSPAPLKLLESCACAEGEACNCCVPRKIAAKSHLPPTHPSGHTPPPVYPSGHSPNNPHQHPHQHHLHAYAPYTRPAVRLSTDAHGTHLANPNANSNAALVPNLNLNPGAMYRLGPCACGTTCACPDCAHHRQHPHAHQSGQTTPVQGHGGEPCPVRCTNCFDCAGGLTMLLDPAAYAQPTPNQNQTSVPPYSAESDFAAFGSEANASVQSFESEAQQAGAYPNGPYATNGSASAFSNGSAPGFFSPNMVDSSGMDVDMDNAEFNAAMAGLDAGIGAGTGAPDAAGCACPPGRCRCPNHNHDAGSFWDRPRCGFAVSTERGGCCSSPDHTGMGHARIGSEVGSEIGVGSDVGIELGSELGIGSDDGGSVVGAGSTNLSVDFADLGFGSYDLAPMQSSLYPDHASQRFSGEYGYQPDRLSAHGDRHSLHGDRFSGRVASTSSQFSNHSNLSLVSSIDSASVSLASLASSHGISSLASSHGISSLSSQHGGMGPSHSPLSGRVTPHSHSGRVTPVRGVTPHSPHNGKPLPKGYRRILPKVAAMTTHRPFRRHHSQQPSLHAVMESDAAGGNVTSPPPSQVLLQPPQQQYGQQAQQPRVRKSVRSHLPIVGKYFAPGGRYEPSRLRNLNQPPQGQQQGQTPAFRGQVQAFQGQSSSFRGQPFQGQQAPYESFSQGSVAQPSFSQSGSPLAFDDQQEYTGEEPVYGEVEIEPDVEGEKDGGMYQEEEEVQGFDVGQQYGVYQEMGQFGPGPNSYVHQASVSLPPHAQMVAALSHAPTTLHSYNSTTRSTPQASQSYSHLPQEHPNGSASSVRPQLPAHNSSQNTAIITVPDNAMHSPPLPPDDHAPPSPRQKVSSGVPMPLTMSLPTTPARALGAQISRTVTHHAFEDADADVKVGVADKDAGAHGNGGMGNGPGGRKSRWPSFSVHGHRVTVGAKYMGAAYASRS